MKKILLACLFLLIAFPVAAAELLMFSNPECKYCQEFLREVEPTCKDSEPAPIEKPKPVLKKIENEWQPKLSNFGVCALPHLYTSMI